MSRSKINKSYLLKPTKIKEVINGDDEIYLTLENGTEFVIEYPESIRHLLEIDLNSIMSIMSIHLCSILWDINKGTTLNLIGTSITVSGILYIRESEGVI